eukprot:scaffold201455_cov36-Tisochrysis_lutea.AAC.2
MVNLLSLFAVIRIMQSLLGLQGICRKPVILTRENSRKLAQKNGILMHDACRALLLQPSSLGVGGPGSAWIPIVDARLDRAQVATVVLLPAPLQRSIADLRAAPQGAWFQGLRGAQEGEEGVRR